MNKKSVGYSKFKYLLVIACVAAGFSFNSCSKDSGIGANVLPQNSYFNAHFSDTATVISSLVLRDSLYSNDLEANLLGGYNDPIFGPTKASFYTQFSLSAGNPFPTNFTPSQLANIVLDSAVLSVVYGGTAGNVSYGDNSPQNVQVYLLDSSLITNKIYYSTDVVAHHILLGSKNILPNFTSIDSGRYGTSAANFYEATPRFRIKLNHAYAQAWMDTGMNRTISGTIPIVRTDTLFGSNAALFRSVKGVYITVNNPLQLPGQGGIWTMDPASTSSQVTFFYHIHNTSNNTDSLCNIVNFYMTANYGGVAFSHFDHDYSTTPFGANPLGKNHDSVFAPNTVYLQATAGVKVKLTMPYLRNWSNKIPVIINKAELDIPVIAYDNSNPFAPPPNIDIIGINDTSSIAATATFQLPDQSLGVYGGNYDAYNQTYNFVITEYIQELIQGKVTNRDFYLVSNSALDPGRVVLQGAAKVPNKQRIRLKIFYTPLKG